MRTKSRSVPFLFVQHCDARPSSDHTAHVHQPSLPLPLALTSMLPCRRAAAPLLQASWFREKLERLSRGDLLGAMEMNMASAKDAKGELKGLLKQHPQVGVGLLGSAGVGGGWGCPDPRRGRGWQTAGEGGLIDACGGRVGHRRLGVGALYTVLYSWVVGRRPVLWLQVCNIDVAVGSSICCPPPLPHPRTARAARTAPSQVPSQRERLLSSRSTRWTPCW